ncbi:MAG: thiamine-phosphate kinase [Kordiimonas sp.]|nr:thiamine-phosphate kinase [Kordiimonas sp.]|tara:strand:+ start:1848 stop:2828 length:981 start_codon:yes stop_codon:yes gene_type:complete
MPGEFDIIKRYFATIAQKNENSFGLMDDAAIFSPAADQALVFTKDILIENIHFRQDDKASQIARKLLRVNLSDLAAMGADPCGYLLGLSLPKETRFSEQWIEDFSNGLANDIETFGGGLWGGDTVATTGPLTLSLTAIGSLPKGQEVLRSGARPGDDIYVSGTLGDAALGLRVLEGDLNIEKEDFSRALVSRYHLPRPRMALGKSLRSIASSMMDISDGLMGDIAHICASSKCGARIYADKLPLSDATQAVLQEHKKFAPMVWSGGDDYELLFTADIGQRGQIMNCAEQCGVQVARIGVTTKELSAVLLDENGDRLALAGEGYRHF